MSTATRTARLVPDKHRARAERVTARAPLRWPRHPLAIGAADESADCGHETNHPPGIEVQRELLFGRLLPPADITKVRHLCGGDNNAAIRGQKRKN
jgi:hypothetical protein